jgi:hypothetical protein
METAMAAIPLSRCLLSPASKQKEQSEHAY